jgi:hypothetical protein
MHARHLATAVAMTLALALLGTAAQAEVFTLKSTTFEDGKMMPKEAANSAANTGNNPN